MAVSLAFLTLTICIIGNNIQANVASENLDPVEVESNFLPRNSQNFFKTVYNIFTSKDGLIHSIEAFVIDELLMFTGDITATCKQDIKYVLSEALDSRNRNGSILESWPLKMLDSFGKPEGGILSGNHFWMGNYDQCVDIEVTEQGSSKARFIGEYCLVEINPDPKMLQTLPINVSLRLGTCFPSSCTIKDKQTIIESLTAPLRQQGILGDVNVPQQSCTAKHPVTIDAITQFSIAILCIPVLLVCVATIADYIWNYWNDSTAANYTRGLSAELLLSFSAIKSIKSLFHRNKINSNLSAIHGIRVLTMIWIITGHNFLVSMYNYPWHNHLDVRKIFKTFIYQPFAMDALLSVTTFFSLSGFLVTYLFMQQIQQHKRPLNFAGFYLYRYIRLTPVYIIVLVVFIGPFALFGQGPIWKMAVSLNIEQCRQGWWKNLLYINSFDRLSNECYGESWYLSTDTMLYLIAPIFLYPLIIKPSVAFFLFGLFSFAATLSTLMLILKRGYVTYVGYNMDGVADFGNYVNDLYIKPWYNFTSYAIGMITGYLLFICETRNIKFTKKVIVPGWILSLLVPSLIIFGKFPYFSGEKHMSSFVNAVYGTFSRPAWAMCVSWIIFACATGNGGLINSFLSMYVFVPMSRVTYSAYLVQFMVILYYFGLQRHSLHFTIYNLVIIICGNVAVTVAASIVLAILGEIPILEMTKQLSKWYFSPMRSTNRVIAGPMLKDIEILKHSDEGTLSLLPKKNADSPESSDIE